MSDYDTLVLSGGGIKGFNLLGGLQASIDCGLLKNIQKFVGTSIGAIICYLLAIGYSPIEIIVSIYVNKFLEKMQTFNLVAMINGNGATSFSGINEALEKLTIDKIGKFLTLGKLRDEYKKTLICITYNMTTCSTEYLGPDNYPDLPCLVALRMSANIPLVFDRFKYMDNFYIDGGIADNFAIQKGIEIGTNVLGIYLEIPEKSMRDEPEDGLMVYFLRLLYIPMIQANKYKIDNIHNDKVIIIPINSGDMRLLVEFDVKSKIRLDMFSNGYNCVKEFLQKKISSNINE